MPKPKYRITIGAVERARPEYWPGCNFSVSLHKLYGDAQWYSTCVATKEDIIDGFQRIRSSWEGFDAILGRMSDPVTAKNLELVVKKGDLTKEDLGLVSKLPARRR